jgi:hypothetical protein
MGLKNAQKSVRDEHHFVHILPRIKLLIVGLGATKT